MDKKLFLQIASVILISALVFTCFVVFITKSETLIGVEVQKEDVPYTSDSDLPVNTTLLFDFDSGTALCIEMKFSSNFLNAVIIDKKSGEKAEDFGFYPTEKIKCGYSFIMKFIDSIDGITLDIFGEELRYTGVQICNILAVNDAHTETKVKILKAVFKKINKIGFSSDTLSCIMNETQNTLSVPDCYGWTEYIKDICNRYNIINEG